MERDNAERFKGFAAVYDEARPSMPLYPVEIIENILAVSRSG